jgi:hypothetical protein
MAKPKRIVSACREKTNDGNTDASSLTTPVTGYEMLCILTLAVTSTVEGEGARACDCN